MTQERPSSLGPRLGDDDARRRFEQLSGVIADDEPRIATILEFADGMPLAIESAARAVSAIGVGATCVALARTVLAASELHDQLERLWQSASTETRALLELLSAFEAAFFSSAIVDEAAFNVAGIEQLIANGCLVSESRPGQERELRLLRPVRVFVREKSSSPAAVATHARVMSRLAGELVIQFEMSGDLEPLQKAAPDFSAVISRALADHALHPQGLAAVRALGPIACFAQPDRRSLAGVRELVRDARRMTTNQA